MDHTEQKLRFYKNVLPARPNEWEVDDVFDLLEPLGDVELEILLAHVGSIWPVSQSLCFSYLSEGAKLLELVPRRYLSEWVRQLISMYEAQGLVGARLFIDDIEKYFLLPLQGESGVKFEEVYGTMLHYIRGISGENIELKIGSLPSTDTTVIYLPSVVSVFGKQQDNRLFFKILATLQWAHVATGTFSEIVGVDGVVADPFLPFSNKRLAKDLFAIVQLSKAFSFLRLEFPGLVRKGSNLCRHLMQEIQPAGGEVEQCEEMKSHFEYALCSGDCSIREKGRDSVVLSLSSLYQKISELPGSYTLGASELLLGEFDFCRASEIIVLRRLEMKNQFTAMLATFLAEAPVKEEEEGAENIDPGERLTETALMVLEKIHDVKEQKEKAGIHLDNEGAEISEELASLIKNIENDLGELPEAYVQAAAGMAGDGVQKRDSSHDGDKTIQIQVAAHSYDEWDYRRGGYRNKWCSLYVKELNPVVSTFVETTLEKYLPQLNRLRRQFEMLRTHDRFVRRRRHGDDIDLDAMIEALGDSKAGLCPTDRLFVRLLRDVRDISTLFLVDMSNSTEGWIGLAIREALVLLAESLEVAGDMYGIYGFSGMRRSKSELFHVKGLDESYGPKVQQRIAAMMPQEYTRMGPPIRHLTKLLKETQSKVRLLVVITDGKPEDYDDYKGQYAIEDTRKALLEAKGSGVHPFCITIDKSAHDYLGHMFGLGNYIFIDKVHSLPAKMSEMYRLLTS